MTNLPIVQVPYAPYNPQFKPVYVNGIATNMHEVRLPIQPLAAEVLTMNLSTGMMRVRFVEKQNNPLRSKDEVVTADVPIAPFFEQYEITKKA